MGTLRIEQGAIGISDLSDTTGKAGERTGVDGTSHLEHDRLDVGDRFGVLIWLRGVPDGACGARDRARMVDGDLAAGECLPRGREVRLQRPSCPDKVGGLSGGKAGVVA